MVVGLDLEIIHKHRLRTQLNWLQQTAQKFLIITMDVLTKYLTSVLSIIGITIAKAYFTQLDQLNSVAAGQYNVIAVRDLSVGIVGFNVNAVYTFNRPTELNEGGIFLDIGRDVHSVVSLNNNADNEKKYMLLTGMYASAMEHGVIEQFTGVESVSTIKVFEYAGKNNIPLHSVTQDNLSDELSVLNVSDKVKQDIRTAVNSGKLVIIPEETLNINQWSGIGYMVLDTDTFACGYMISGGLAGGSMTWDQALSEYLFMVGTGLIFGLLVKLAAALIVTPWVGVVFYAALITMAIVWVYQLYELYQMWQITDDPYYIQEIGIQLLAGITIAGIFGACGSKLNAEIEALAAKIKASPLGQPIGGGGTCFIAGTLISTQEGLVPIENIKVGDIVYSFDEETQEVSEQSVEETFVRESSELVDITVGDETITTTPEHPFYIPKKGFVNAVDLRAGDSLWTVNGEYVIIEKIQHEILELPITVYNFKVANNHMYFVGNIGIGVHNSDVCVGDVNVEETNELLDYFNDPEYYLNNALERQGRSEAPSKFKEVWTEGGYKYEVRIHPGESEYTDAETIYRVSRQSTELNEFGQGSGKEYLSSDGKWYQESSLKQYYKNGTENPNYDAVGAEKTHISLNKNSC